MTAPVIHYVCCNDNTVALCGRAARLVANDDNEATCITCRQRHADIYYCPIKRSPSLHPQKNTL